MKLNGICWTQCLVSEGDYDMRGIIAYVVFEDGSAHIALYKLEGGLPFGKREMERWIREQSGKSVKSVVFITGEVPGLRGRI